MDFPDSRHYQWRLIMAFEERLEWYGSVSVADRVTKDGVMILSCHDSVATGADSRVPEENEPARSGEYRTPGEQEQEKCTDWFTPRELLSQKAQELTEEMEPAVRRGSQMRRLVAVPCGPSLLFLRVLRLVAAIVPPGKPINGREKAHKAQKATSGRQCHQLSAISNLCSAPNLCGTNPNL